MHSFWSILGWFEPNWQPFLHFLQDLANFVGHLHIMYYIVQVMQDSCYPNHMDRISGGFSVHVTDSETM